MSDTTTEITNMEDVIDSRDVIARIAELEALERAATLAGPEYDDERYELAALLRLAEEAADYSEDWEYGATLIRDSYFKEYAQELAEDLGAIEHNGAWPTCHIDWDAAANSLRMDYTAVTFDDVTYWVR